MIPDSNQDGVGYDNFWNGGSQQMSFVKSLKKGSQVRAEPQTTISQRISSGVARRGGGFWGRQRGLGRSPAGFGAGVWGFGHSAPERSEGER